MSGERQRATVTHGLRPSASMSAAKADERARIAAMSPTDRILLALRLGRRMRLLQALRPPT